MTAGSLLRLRRISQDGSCSVNERSSNLLAQVPGFKVHGTVSPIQVVVWYSWPHAPTDHVRILTNLFDMKIWVQLVMVATLVTLPKNTNDETPDRLSWNLLINDCSPYLFLFISKTMVYRKLDIPLVLTLVPIGNQNLLPTCLQQLNALALKLALMDANDFPRK